MVWFTQLPTPPLSFADSGYFGDSSNFSGGGRSFHDNGVVERRQGTSHVRRRAVRFEDEEGRSSSNLLADRAPSVLNAGASWDSELEELERKCSMLPSYMSRPALSSSDIGSSSPGLARWEKDTANYDGKSDLREYLADSSESLVVRRMRC